MTKTTANAGAFEHTQIVLRYHHLYKHSPHLRKEIALRVQQDAQKQGHTFTYIGPEKTVREYFSSLETHYSRTQDYARTLNVLSKIEQEKIGLIVAKISNNFSTKHPPKSVRRTLPKKYFISDETVTTTSAPFTAVDEGPGDASPHRDEDPLSAPPLDTPTSEAAPSSETDTDEEETTLEIFLPRAPQPPVVHRYDRYSAAHRQPYHQAHLLRAATTPPSPPQQAAGTSLSENAKEANQSTQEKSPSLMLSRILKVDSQSSQETPSHEPD